MSRCLHGKNNTVYSNREDSTFRTTHRYDIISGKKLIGDMKYGNKAYEDEDGTINFAMRPITEILTSEIEASPYVAESRIVLGGFTQGGAMALITGITTQRKLAGVFGLSSYMPLIHNFWNVSLKPGASHRGLTLVGCNGACRAHRGMRSTCLSSWGMGPHPSWSIFALGRHLQIV